MMQSHDDLESLAEGYALLALEPEETRAFEAHLATCDICARRVAMARSVVDVLPLAAEPHAPPPGLRDRVLAAARQPPTVRSAPQPAGRLRRLFPLRAVAVAALALLATTSGLAYWNVTLQQATDLDLARLDLSYQAIEIMGQADGWHEVKGTAAAPQATGTIATSSSQGASCLVVWNLPQDPQAVYHAWIMRDGVATHAGYLWPVRSARWVVIPGVLGDMDGVLVTMEKEMGMTEPSGDVLIRVSFPSAR